MNSFQRIAPFGTTLALCALVLSGCAAVPDTSADKPASSTSGSLIALPADIAASGVIRVGTSPNFPPLEYLDPDTTELMGSDIDLLEKLGEALGVKIEITQQPFDQLINSVQTGRVDIVISGISDTVERQETLDIVDYFNSEGRLYTTEALASNFTKQTDICGKTLAVSGKTDYFQQVQDLSDEVCTSAGLPELTILPTDSGPAARLQIEQGRVDLAAQGSENLSYISKTGDVKYQAVLEPLPEEPFGILVKKGNTELSDALIAALTVIIANGDYDSVLEEWDIAHGAREPVLNGVAG